MKKLVCHVPVLLILLTMTLNCSSGSKLYRMKDKNKIVTGKLTDSEFMSVSEFLEKATSLKPKDTIIIKYDYNKESCWNRLDQQNADYINNIISWSQSRVQNAFKERPNLTVYRFREPGNNVNKIIDWDNSIVIDNDKRLFSLLFSQRSICGNSILLMPDGKYVFMRSDSHFEVLDLTQNDLHALLDYKAE